MWRNQRERPDDPSTRERETQRLSRDEYERPQYGGTPFDGSMRGEWHGPHHGGPAAPPLHAIRAHEVMTRHVATVQPGTPVERAARIMEEADCGALPVSGDNGVLVGMITDRDIALRVVARGRDARHTTVGDCMTGRVFACHAGDSLAHCIDQMARHQVRRLPIIDERGRVVGIVAQSDLARHAARHAAHGERAEVARFVCAVSEPSDVPYR
jgi:CBS domain-containing protein